MNINLKLIPTKSKSYVCQVDGNFLFFTSSIHTLHKTGSHRVTGRILLDQSMIKMVYLIGPDGLVNQRFANFHKMVWMTTVYIIHIHAVFWKFAYPQFTGYAEYIRFCHKEHLKNGSGVAWGVTSGFYRYPVKK